VFLGIEVRRARRKIEDLQAGVGCQDGLNLGTPMPGRPIPQQQNGLIRISQQDFF
jgi:hypothetical protein